MLPSPWYLIRKLILNVTLLIQKNQKIIKNEKIGPFSDTFGTFVFYLLCSVPGLGKSCLMQVKPAHAFTDVLSFTLKLISLVHFTLCPRRYHIDSLYCQFTDCVVCCVTCTLWRAKLSLRGCAKQSQPQPDAVLNHGGSPREIGSQHQVTYESG